MSAPARRAILGGASIALVAAGAALAPVAAGATAVPADEADAELIRACAQHAINMDAYNATDEINNVLNGGPEPLWEAYEKTRNFISEAKPATIAGVLAKARAAKHEARTRSGEENWGASMGELWAFDIVNDLVRLAGAGAQQRH